MTLFLHLALFMMNFRYSFDITMQRFCQASVCVLVTGQG